jgi:hypothetical protein
MKGTRSGYEWRPDLVIANSEYAPTAENVTDIIECKHRRRLDAVTIRTEFAKAYDLKVESYLIWSYFEVSQAVLDGTDRLGIQVKTIGLGKKERGPFLDPLVLSRHIAEGVREARERSRFATTLAQAASEAQDKAIRDGRQL